MIARGDVFDADLGEHGRRPCLVVTRETAIPMLSRVNVVLITSTIRGHPAEIELDERHGLDRACAANCDVIVNVAKSALVRRRGGLDPATMRRMDAALVIALGLEGTLG